MSEQHKWYLIYENTAKDGDIAASIQTNRMDVPGGWLYSSVTVMTVCGKQHIQQSQTFVPHPPGQTISVKYDRSPDGD